MDKTNKAIAVFDKYAQQYQDKFMAFGAYHDSFDLFCRAIKKQNATVLELACGPGNITKYLLKQRPDLNILGTDLSVKMLELAKKNNPTAAFKLMDCRDINKLNEKYDGLMCGFWLPYLDKEEAIKLIGDAVNIIKLEGVLYISTMEDDYAKSGLKGSSSNPQDQCFIHYHEAEYLTKALEENGFEILDLQRKDYTEPNGSITKDLLILAKRSTLK